MPATSPPGRSMVTRGAVADLVHAAALGSYGVTGLADRSIGARLLRSRSAAEPTP